MNLGKNLLRQQRARGMFTIVFLLILGIAATVFLEAHGKDLEWTGTFYSAGGKGNGWVHAREAPWDLLYDYGEIPGIALAVGAALFLVVSHFRKAFDEYRKPCLVIILTVIIGPGILVNGILKNYWGRPRPVDIVAFGGHAEYRKTWPPGGASDGKSFTCGHCAMAFSISSAVAFFPYHPVASIAALFAGVAFGIITGIARVVQGGHFVTDVLWSGIIIMTTIAALYWLVFRIPEAATHSVDHERKSVS